MRYLLTGAAGFIGSHLADRLLANGDEVIGVDNLSTGRNVNLEGALQNPRFELRIADVTHPVPFDGRLDWVLHFASAANVPAFSTDPIGILRVNGEGTFHLLELARRTGAGLMLASTSEVYGDPLAHPQPESYRGNVNPIGTRSPYDEGKRYAEAMVTAHHRVHGTRTRIVRIFNTYGPRMDPMDPRVVPTFVRQALRGLPITVDGDGSQTRSFQYVDDLVDGIVRLLSVEYVEPVNIGNPTEFTVLQLANLVREIAGDSCPIVHRPLPADDPKRRCPDISLARSLLSWSPKVDLADGLTRTIDAMRVELG
jgi:dTDP-glucose 4,6-dehydratase